jgi:hypothetical protein
VLVLPEVETMTPGLLRKVSALVKAGATVIGPRPLRSPSLSGYPQCDAEIARLAAELWGSGGNEGGGVLDRAVGQGRVLCFARSAGAKAIEPPAIGAEVRWIWHPEGNPASAAPVATRHFRRLVNCPADGQIASARLAVTADNGFEATVNGHTLGKGDSFREWFVFDLAPHLRPGGNAIAVAAVNGGDRPNPAGLAGVIEVRFEDGRVGRAVTDAAWESATDAAGPFVPAKELGPVGMGPWGQIGRPASANPPPLYGAFEDVIGVLAAAGVRPDFEGGEALRHAHRRDRDTDIYFVANRESAPVQASCAFRVEGRQPELWDPRTGRVRPLPTFRCEPGRTVVPLAFEPHESWFVVFRRPLGDAAPDTTGDVAGWGPALELRGPWEVEFQSGRKAPERLTWEALKDWTVHPDPGVKHFSGTAVYRTKFTFSEPVIAPGRPRAMHLDLGKVEVMARVRLNGQELGTAWALPYRVEVGEALRIGENTLEITVANLWPNRLIGDQALPAADRVTWTTWNPYRADSPLAPSGLLGPVRLLREER